MLEIALKFEKAFDRFKEDDQDFCKELKDGVPEKEDWVNAQVLAMCLKQFCEATKRMSGSLYVTSNMHFHEILRVLASLVKWENSTNSNIREMGRQMREKFNEYYGDLGKTNVMMLVAVVLDPRFKFRFVKFSLRKLFALDLVKVDDICDRLYYVLKKLFEHYLATVTYSSKYEDHNSRCSTINIDGQEKTSLANNEKMKDLYDEYDKEDCEGAVVKCELDTYLEEGKEKRVEGEFFDILQWWKVKNEKYKVLAIMAKDILAIPVSTVSNESAFSTLGRVLNQFRSSLGPKTVEALVCAQNWLRTSEISMDIERFLEDVEKYEEELDDSSIRQVEDIMEEI